MAKLIWQSLNCRHLATHRELCCHAHRSTARLPACLHINPLPILSLNYRNLHCHRAPNVGLDMFSHLMPLEGLAEVYEGLAMSNAL